ncbi:unnamed protein product [Lupinus luteus]|uniref:Uncharacterized protein n=1 Tax=Lupinus luteus TaxID=3873 RepID=A0AAV1Y907_LUPLU
MGGFGDYLPDVIGMIGLQIHYAALTIFTRAALLDGLSPTETIFNDFNGIKELVVDVCHLSHWGNHKSECIFSRFILRIFHGSYCNE